MTDAENAELRGLLQVRDNFEEQYDPEVFSEEHAEFKNTHNGVFLRLIRYCEDRREEPPAADADAATTRVFFLDGPDGGTASALVHKGNLEPSQCYVANRHESTCDALRRSGGGILPEENVVHATSSEALSKRPAPDIADLTIKEEEQQRGAFAHLEFTGYYFDGCGGYVPHVVNMMSSALLVVDTDGVSGNDDNNTANLRKRHLNPIVVGYSLLGGKKNVVEKELEISRALTIIARSMGMRMVHALDDPSRFGLPPSVSKLGGNSENTFTTWLVLEPDDYR